MFVRQQPPGSAAPSLVRSAVRPGPRRSIPLMLHNKVDCAPQAGRGLRRRRPRNGHHFMFRQDKRSKVLLEMAKISPPRAKKLPRSISLEVLERLTIGATELLCSSGLWGRELRAEYRQLLLVDGRDWCALWRILAPLKSACLLRSWGCSDRE